MAGSWLAQLEHFLEKRQAVGHEFESLYAALRNAEDEEERGRAFHLITKVKLAEARLEAMQGVAIAGRRSVSRRKRCGISRSRRVVRWAALRKGDGHPGGAGGLG
jgi:hypothetical protein